MKILFAISQDTSNNIQENILKEYQEKYYKTFEYKSEYYLEGVLKCLNEEKFDILILNEALENELIDISVIDKLTDHHSELQVIIAIDNKHREDEFTNQLYMLGVYDALYLSDFNIENLISIINSGRNKKQAKEYYGIEENNIEDIDLKFQVVPIQDEELNRVIKVLQNSIPDGNLNNIFKQVDKEYNTKEMCYLLTMLPESIINELDKTKNKIFLKYKKIVNTDIRNIEKQKNVEVQYIEKVKEVEVIKEVEVEKEKPIIVEKEVYKVNKVRYDSIISVVSNAPTGKTYLTWNLAYALAESYKVAVISIDKNSSANAYFGIIDEDISYPLDNIENKSIREIAEEGIQITKNLTLYTGKFGEKAELLRNTLLSLVSSLRAENNIIIIDTMTGYSKNLLSALQISNDILFVYNMDNAHIRLNNKLLRNLGEEKEESINSICVLNNVFRESREYKDVLNHLEKSNNFQQVITVSNAGNTSYDCINSKTCNYLKDNSDFTRDIDVLINALKLEGKTVNSNKKKGSLINKLLRRGR